MSDPGSRRRAVFDVHVFVRAVARGHSAFAGWPSPPPASDNPFADCLGIANDAREFSLWVSERVLVDGVRVLRRGFGWGPQECEDYAALIVEIARASGGGIVEPTVLVNECEDHEDNRILELALAVAADLIVSGDVHLTSMSPWRGIPIITPRDFVSRVDAARRARRR